MSSTITAALSPQRPARANRARRKRWIVIGLLLYTVLGFFVAPAIIKWQLQKQLPALTHRQATVKQVRVNPYALSLTVRGLALTETNGTPFVGFDELYVNFQLSSLFHWAWTFSEIKLVRPTANVVRVSEAEFNFSDLLTNNTPASTSFTLPPVLIQHLRLTNILVTVTDQTTPKPFHVVLGPTQVELNNLDTRPNERGPYTVTGNNSDGEAFDWTGTVSVRPPQSRGEFKLRNISPAKYGPYLAFFTTAQVARGQLDVSATYAVNAASFPPQLEVTNLDVHLRDFEVQSPEGNETLLTLPDLLVENVSGNLTGATVRVPLVKLSGGSAFVRRDAQGQLEAEKYVFPPTNGFAVIRQFAARIQAGITADLSASLDELSVNDFAVTMEDRSLPTVARLGLDKLNVAIKGVSNQTNAPVSATVGFDWRGGGRAQIETQATLLPLAAQANLTVSHLSLVPLQPYVGQQANLAVQAGELSVDGAAQFDPNSTNTPLLRFTGNVAITNFLSSDTITYHEFAGWENLGVHGLQFQLEPNRLDVDEMKFTGLRANLVVSSNGQISALALLKRRPVATAIANATDQTGAGAAAFPLKLGALVFEHGSLGAADESLGSPFRTQVEEFEGSVRDITFPGLTRATIDLRGKVSALAPFSVTGTLTPDFTNPFADLTITFTNTDLTPFTPYSEKFAGYPLNKGKLSFAVHYRIENRAVKGENRVALDKLTLGAHNQSPDATKLPVKLGVALLKDRNGLIDLNLPVSGSLDDPSFQIGGLVWNAIVNILVKAATSPFSLLGALVGGGEELQYVEFNPGLARLNDSQTNKLAKLIQALQERPGLNLEISATYDPVTDVGVLGEQKVRERIKGLAIQEMVARGKTPPAIEDLQLDDDDYERLLRQAYREAFNTTPEIALRAALVAAASTNASDNGVSPTTSPTPTIGQGRGATALLRRQMSLSELEAQNRRSSDGGATPANVKPRTERELIRAQMEERLLAQTPVTNEDLLALIQRRIETVQKFLVGAGQVEAGRLFPLSPKSADAAKGKARVVFSLN